MQRSLIDMNYFSLFLQVVSLHINEFRSCSFDSFVVFQKELRLSVVFAESVSLFHSKEPLLEKAALSPHLELVLAFSSC